MTDWMFFKQHWISSGLLILTRWKRQNIFFGILRWNNADEITIEDEGKGE